MNLGGPELLIILLVVSLMVVPVGLAIWGVVDAATRPDRVWQETGQNKVVWIVVPIVLVFLCGPFALVMTFVYFTTVRPQLVRAQASGV